MNTIGLITLFVATLLSAWNASITLAREAELTQSVQASGKGSELSGFENDVEKFADIGMCRK